MLNDTNIRRLKLLRQECQKYNNDPTIIPSDERQDLAFYFSSIFRNYEDFAELGMLFLGFKLSDIQRDIAKFMQYGGQKIMVQAQRG